MRSGIVGTAGVVVALGLLVAGCSSASHGPHPTHPTKPPGLAPVGVRGPVGLAAVDSELWVVSSADGTVQHRDGRTGRLVRAVPVGRTPLRVVVSGALVWVSVFGDDRVKAVDRRTGAIVRDVSVPGQPEGLAVAGGQVWVVRQAAGVVTAINADGTLGRTVTVGQEPRLDVAAGRFVVVSNFSGTLTRVDTTTGAAVTSARLCQGPQGLTYSAADLWVACTGQDVVLRVDLDALRVLATVPVPGEPDAVHAVAGGVQVTATAGPTLYTISAAARPVVTRVVPVSHAAALADQANVDAATVAGLTWVSSFGEDTVWRVPAG